MILALRTDSSEAGVYLFDENGDEVSSEHWHADRSLAVTLLERITSLLKQSSGKSLNLGGIIFYSGPGSFTGLRIGATVANTYAYSESLPIVGAKGEDWIRDGIQLLQSGHDERVVLPEYGGEAHVTL